MGIKMSQKKIYSDSGIWVLCEYEEAEVDGFTILSYFENNIYLSETAHIVWR